MAGDDVLQVPSDLEKCCALRPSDLTITSSETFANTERPVENKQRRLDLMEVPETEHTSSKSNLSLGTRHFNQEIDSSWTVAMIVACYFVAGLVDSVSYGIWSTFVNMQTGNTILLALRIAGQPQRHHRFNWIKCLTSVFCYCLGALFFNALHRAPTSTPTPNARPPLSRWKLLLSFIIQAAALASIAVLAYTHTVSTLPFSGGSFSSGTPSSPGDNYRDLVAIAVLAFEAAGQVCLSRVLVVNELPTLVISTLYHDFIGDVLSMPRYWRESNHRIWPFLVSQKRQLRRLACIIALFGGALIGGLVFSSSAGLSGAMWIAAAVKVGICVAWCVWRKKEPEETA